MRCLLSSSPALPKAVILRVHGTRYPCQVPWHLDSGTRDLSWRTQQGTYSTYTYSPSNSLYQVVVVVVCTCTVCSGRCASRTPCVVANVKSHHTKMTPSPCRYAWKALAAERSKDTPSALAFSWRSIFTCFAITSRTVKQAPKGRAAGRQDAIKQAWH